MSTGSERGGGAGGSSIRAFLIADLRGYTSYTEEHGDEAAAALTTRFAALAGAEVEAHGGSVVELRGDEVLAEFVSARDCLRAALAIQESIAGADGFPLAAGVGLDVGEAVPVGDGFRGRAINMAARLCARAQPGETLVTPELAHLAGAVDGIVYEDGGPVQLKGFSRPVHLLAAVVQRADGSPHDQARVLFCGVLGPLEVKLDGHPVALGGPKQRLVLAHLVLAANRVVGMDELIDAVWPEEPPHAARNTIQSYVSHLRGALGADRIESRAPGYVFHAEPEELDALGFERDVRRARRWIETDSDRAIDAFDEALRLWRGAPLSDVAEAPSLDGEIARLDELRLTAIEDGIDVRLGLADRDVVGELQPLVERYPLRERLWGQLLIALYRAGRQGDALAAYDRARSMLSEELGVDPSPELRELHARILQQDPSLQVSGRPLRSYRVLEQIGAGSDGEVWRALDPAVGREVAIKQIRPEHARDPAFVRRLQQEAQVVARLEHPHIVPLYDIWRDGNGAFIVMRLLRGGSVASAIADGPLRPERACAVASQIASALAAVHRQHVAHRDVRPENVLLDEEGNAYLSDLGIAIETNPDEEASAGTDLVDLGALLASMVGENPPAPIADVIARAGAEDPAERFADAEAFVAALAAASRTQPTVAPDLGDVRNPYKGLRAFSEADAGDFFGRDALTARLVERLCEPTPAGRFLALVGPSGSGKSSVVRAGLLPALRTGLVPGAERWFLTDMRPGARPMDELETALLETAIDPTLPLVDGLERDPNGLTAAIERILPPDGTELLLLVDQFEEVFTLVDDENDRARFLETLVAAVDNPASRLRLVVTLRADFFDRPLAYPGLAELMRARSETVVPLTAAELERAISGPAEGVGVVPELALVAEAVGDVTDQPGALPLLQYAMTETFETRTAGVLTLEAYRATGGVTGALASRAEQLYGAMNDEGRAAARQLFLRLVTVGEGTEDTRRLVSRAELASLEVDQHAMDAVITAFGKHRLLSFDRDPETRGPTVEVAHEALLRAWMRLRGWIDAAREDVLTHARLAAEADEWERSGRDPSFLLRGSRLAHLEGWAASTTLALSAVERRLLAESVAARAAHDADERQRAERERDLERRSVRRLRTVVAVLAAAALVASTLVVVAVGQGHNARDQASIAQARELAAAADANLSTDPERSVLLALEAVDTARPGGQPLPEAVQSLQNAVAANRLLMTLADPSTGNVAYSPDGQLIATGGSVGGSAQTDVLLWDAHTGELVHPLEGHTDDIWSVAFDPTGDLLVSTSDNREAIVWNTADGTVVRRFPGLGASASFDPEGATIVAADNGIIHEANVSTGKNLASFADPDHELCSPTFSPDGAQLVAGRCDRTGLDVWDVASHRIVRVLGKSSGVGFLGGVFSPDGSQLASNAEEGQTLVWEMPSGRLRHTINGYRGAAYGLAFSFDGTTLATSGTDGTARIWNTSDGRQLEVLAGHQGLVGMVAFSPDGSRVVTGGADGTARVWDVSSEGPGLVMGVRSYGDQLWSVAFTPDARQLVTTGNRDGWVWDLATGDRVRSILGAYSAGTVGIDGTYLLAGDGSQPHWGWSIWDLESGRREHFMATPNGVQATAVSTNGERAIGLGCWSSPRCDSVGVLVWDEASPSEPPERFGRTTEQNYGIAGVALTRDGARLASIDGRGLLQVWDVASGKRLVTVRAQSGLATGVAFNPDGSIVATSGGEGVTLWGTGDGRLLATLAGVGASQTVAFSADGTHVAAGGDDDRTTIWGVESARRVLTIGGLDNAIITGVGFSPDGSMLATVDTAGLLKVHPLTLEGLETVARSQITRGLTDAECLQYLQVSPCPSDIATPATQPPTPLPSVGPQGAFRSDISIAELIANGMTVHDARANFGRWTLLLLDGRFTWHQSYPNGGVWQTSGTYTATSDRLTFTIGDDPYCLGTTWSAQWRRSGPDLILGDVRVDATTPSCPAADYEPFARDVAELHPWRALSHHASVG